MFFASILAKVIAIVSAAAGAAQAYVRSFVPCFIARVVHLSAKPDAGGRATTIYEGFRWSASNAWTMAVPMEGHYIIQMWSPVTRKIECYVLAAAHLASALGLRDLGSLWAFSAFGIGVLLHAHMSMVNKSRKLLGLVLEDPSKGFATDVLAHPLMARYKDSFLLTRNMTADSVAALWAYETGSSDDANSKKDDKRQGGSASRSARFDSRCARCTLVDYDLEETTAAGSVHLFPLP